MEGLRIPGWRLGQRKNGQHAAAGLEHGKAGVLEEGTVRFHQTGNRFVAEVSIPKQGVCHFDMKYFKQTESFPNVVLTDGASGCVVRMWEQEKGVTVAFNACQSKCGGDAFSYLWPILVDTRNGRCT